MRYFRQFYAQCGKAVLLYLLLTIVHKILAFISPPITQWLIDAAIAGNASEFWRMLIFEVLTTLAFMAALYLRNVHGDITENRVVAFAEKRTFSDMLRMPYKEPVSYTHLSNARLRFPASFFAFFAASLRLYFILKSSKILLLRVAPLFGRQLFPFCSNRKSISRQISFNPSSNIPVRLASATSVQSIAKYLCQIRCV